LALYSEMTVDELKKEMKNLQKLGKNALEEKRWNEYEIHMTKWYLAKSYEMLASHSIEVGQRYAIAEEEQEYFTVTGLEGIMAWGFRESTGETDSLPIARLEEVTD
jgi:hypothetical protein